MEIGQALITNYERVLDVIFSFPANRVQDTPVGG